jgi:hypothetical protein
VLTGMLRREREYFTAHPQEAAALLTVGQHPPARSLPPAEIAATAMVTRAVMSHDECVNR